jgi:hypothetical protein
MPADLDPVGLGADMIGVVALCSRCSSINRSPGVQLRCVEGGNVEIILRDQKPDLRTSEDDTATTDHTLALFGARPRALAVRARSDRLHVSSPMFFHNSILQEQIDAIFRFWLPNI